MKGRNDDFTRKPSPVEVARAKARAEAARAEAKAETSRRREVSDEADTGFEVDSTGRAGSARPRVTGANDPDGVSLGSVFDEISEMLESEAPEPDPQTHSESRMLRGQRTVIRSWDYDPNLDVPLTQQHVVRFYIVGETPLIFNRMAEKAKRELLLPRPGKITAAEKASRPKHDPPTEFRDAVHRRRDGDPELRLTRLFFPAPAFKGAMATAALDLPSLHKTQINRLVWVDALTVPVWGVPELLMSVVRNSDRNRTPDIRTRAILRRWATAFDVCFIRPMVAQKHVLELVRASGWTVGAGDFRQEKGKGSFGQFRLTDPSDAEFQDIIRNGGTEAQDAALDPRLPPEDIACYDFDSEDLLKWWVSETKRRTTETPVSRVRKSATGKTSKKKKAEEANGEDAAEPSVDLFEELAALTGDERKAALGES